ncbi:DegV family protein [Moraxella osloensis]|uniref:DegV family protein n=1 Tax=Faucicola osloensis TaxID=34062 RepID=A0AAD2JBI6_FAUOS|nr:DegV family protein [Moraxella osloensis]ATW70533.1 DegV family protein [Moraxella osloensis]ATY49234.1 DegV family protein [Moraxella osloensis]
MIVSTSTSCLDDLGIPENVKMLPMNIHMGGANYLDGQNLSLDSLSRILLDTPNIDISTSAPTENQLIEFFYQLIKEDVQEVLFICLSSSLSQTYKNLLNISSMFSHRMKIYIYDSRTISHGEAILVQEASRLLKQGTEIPQIITEINRLRDKIHIYLAVDNLKGMIRTKRISAPVGFFANLFGIKPIVKVEYSGQIVAFEKVRSFEKCIERLADAIITAANGKKGTMYVLSGNLNPHTKSLLNYLSLRGYAKTEVLPAASVSIANIGVFTLGCVFVED